MSRDHLSSKDLRAVSAINYQLYADESTRKLKKIIETLGKTISAKLNVRRTIVYEARMAMRSLTAEEHQKINEILNQVDQFIAIMSTAGHPAANELLARKFNALHDAVNPSYPYDFPSADLIIKRANVAIKTFKMAVAKSFQVAINISQHSQMNAFQNQAILGAPQVRALPLKRMISKDEEISED